MLGLLLLIPSVVACQSRKVTPTISVGATADETLISATGKVLPSRWANLGFAASGVVKEVLVVEGQQVNAGAPLARLDLPEVEGAVAQAEATVALARAQLARLESGARPVELRGAEVAVEAAQEGVKAAEAAAKVAQANVAAAEAAASTVQASLRRVKVKPSADELELARQNVELAKAQRYAAQGQRDAIGGLRGRSMGGDPVAQASYQEGSYEAAKGQVLASETTVTIAEINQRILAIGARKEDIAVAEAQVRQAQAAVETAKAQTAAAQQQVVISQRQVAQAQAQLDLLRAPTRDQDLEVARAQVAQAEAALESAKAALAKTWLHAPFAGTVTDLNLRPGEFVMGGAPVIALGDLAVLHVETTDLDEIDAARIAEGRQATLTFDALPGLQIRGTVQRIALKASSASGGTTYKATITLEKQEPRLRWGMTTFADIQAE